MIVDTHAHLTDERFAGETDEVVTRASAAGVDWLVTIATDLDGSEAAIRLAEAHPSVYASVGCHPHSAEKVTREWFERFRELSTHPKVVAIGETGLDFYYDNSPREAQLSSFQRHLELGRETGLPVIVHARDADAEVGRTMLEAGWDHGVLHCFSGGRDLLDLALSLGWYISFAGMITFPKWEGADLLRSVPLDRLLVETDSPYLAPVPHRGRRNEPAHVIDVARRAAEIRGEDSDALMSALSKNARTFYGVDAR